MMNHKLAKISMGAICTGLLLIAGYLAWQRATGWMRLMQCAPPAEVQDLDYSVSHTSPAGPRVSVVRTPSQQAASVALSPDDRSGEMDPSVYCLHCRELLASVATEGYVIVDLYDLEHITAYSIAAGAKYTIRDYTVTVERDGLFYLVTTTAHLF